MISFSNCIIYIQIFYFIIISIKSLYINDTVGKGNQGLFGTVSESASIKDVVIESGKISSNGDNIGAIAGKLEGTIDGCENHVVISGRTYVGGITGYSINPQRNSKLL